MAENAVPEINIKIDAAIFQKTWNKFTKPEDFNQLKSTIIGTIRSLFNNNAGLDIQQVDVAEFTEATSGVAHGLYIPLPSKDTEANRKLQMQFEVLRKKGIVIPYLEKENKLRVGYTRFGTDSQADLRYGRIEIHKYGRDTTLVWIHCNKKLYRAFPSTEGIMTEATSVLGNLWSNDAIYLYSDGTNRNHNKIIYFSRGKLSNEESGKDTWKYAEEIYGISIGALLDRCFTNVDIDMAPNDIAIIESHIKKLSPYIPFIDNPKKLLDPRISDEKRQEIIERIGILKGLMQEYKKTQSLVNQDPEVDVFLFKVDRC